VELEVSQPRGAGGGGPPAVRLAGVMQGLPADLATLARRAAAPERRRRQLRQAAPAPVAAAAAAAAPGQAAGQGLPTLAQGVLGTQFDVDAMRQTTDQARR
jgi:hypothetical protein